MSVKLDLSVIKEQVEKTATVSEEVAHNNTYNSLAFTIAYAHKNSSCAKESFLDDASDIWDDLVLLAAQTK